MLQYPVRPGPAGRDPHGKPTESLRQGSPLVLETPPPLDALARWWSVAPRGRALDLGAGSGEAAVWLAGQGFLVDAVEHDREAVTYLQRARAGRTIVVHPVDLRVFPLEPKTYALVLASAVLHFLRPSELWPLADRLCDCLLPGGLLVAEVLTIDDPEVIGVALGRVLRKSNPTRS